MQLFDEKGKGRQSKARKGKARQSRARQGKARKEKREKKKLASSSAQHPDCFESRYSKLNL